MIKTEGMFGFFGLALPDSGSTEYWKVDQSKKRAQL